MDNKNLFSIGEIAKVIGITRKIILNYEAKGLITPDKKDGILQEKELEKYSYKYPEQIIEVIDSVKNHEEQAAQEAEHPLAVAVVSQAVAVAAAQDKNYHKNFHCLYL